MSDKKKGWYLKYKVERVDGKNDCRDLNTRYSSQSPIWECPEYFVLKLWRKQYPHRKTKACELAAIKAYADEADKQGYGELAKDLRNRYL